MQPANLRIASGHGNALCHTGIRPRQSPVWRFGRLCEGGAQAPVRPRQRPKVRWCPESPQVLGSNLFKFTFDPPVNPGRLPAQVPEPAKSPIQGLPRPFSAWSLSTTASETKARNGIPRSAARDLARRKMASGISRVVFMVLLSHIYGSGSRKRVFIAPPRGGRATGKRAHLASRSSARRQSG